MKERIVFLQEVYAINLRIIWEKCLENILGNIFIKFGHWSYDLRTTAEPDECFKGTMDLEPGDVA